MIEQIKKELLEVQDHDEIFTRVYIEHVTYLIGEVEQKKRWVNDLLDNVRHWKERSNEKLVRIEELQKALEFYANCEHIDKINFRVRDTGEVAKQALKEGE